MKIRIIKSTFDKAWYSDRVGDIFDAIPSIVYGTDKFVTGDGYVLGADAEILLVEEVRVPIKESS